MLVARFVIDPADATIKIRLLRLAFMQRIFKANKPDHVGHWPTMDNYVSFLLSYSGVRLRRILGDKENLLVLSNARLKKMWQKFKILTP